MIVLINKPANLRCFDCGNPIEGNYISQTHPWGTIDLHPDCARDFGRELEQEAAECFFSVLALPFNSVINAIN